MPTFGYVITAIAALGVAAVLARHQLTLRRWVIYLYCFLMVFLAFAVFMVAPRLAMSRLEAKGGTWSQEAAHGALAMHGVYMWLFGTLLVMAVVLATLALRPPKQ